MRRSQFLKMGGVGLLGLVLPSIPVAAITQSTPISVPSALDHWQRSIGAKMSRSGDMIRVKVAMRQADLSNKLEQLAQLADSNLYASGNTLTGNCEGRPFEIVLS